MKNHYVLHQLFMIGTQLFFVVAIYGISPLSQVVLLKKGTEVNLRLVENVHSGKVEIGNVLQLEVDIDVIGEGGIPVIRTGAYATGIVKRVRKKGILGRRGELILEAISVKAIDGTSIHLNGKALIKKGKGRTGMATAIGLGTGLATSFIISSNRENESFSPEGILGAGIGLFVQGASIEVELGEPLYAQVVEDQYVNVVQ